MQEVDVRSLACPGPVLKLREILDSGEKEIRMLVADDLALSNVSRFAATRNCRVESSPGSGGGHVVEVFAGEESARHHEGEEAYIVCDPTQPPVRRGPTVVQITSEKMGLGDDELGGLLLRSFLKTQAELEEKPDSIIFYNGGVRLCCEGSTLLEDLRSLEAGGVEIIACGTCLNYFGLAAALEVGRGSDMLEIASRLAEAGHIVRP